MATNRQQEAARGTIANARQAQSARAHGGDLAKGGKGRKR